MILFVTTHMSCHFFCQVIHWLSCSCAYIIIQSLATPKQIRFSFFLSIILNFGWLVVQTLSGPVTDPSKLPKWNYDGSSTGQAPGEDSEVIL